MNDFNLTTWLDSLEDKTRAHMNGGDELCAMLLQRFHVHTDDEAAEAERRARLNPYLVLEVVEEDLRDACMPEWTPTTWWAFDFDAEIARRSESDRKLASTDYAMDNADDSRALTGALGLVLKEGWRVDTETALACCDRHPLRAPDFHTSYCVSCNVDALHAEADRMRPLPA